MQALDCKYFHSCAHRLTLRWMQITTFLVVAVFVEHLSESILSFGGIALSKEQRLTRVLAACVAIEMSFHSRSQSAGAQ